METYGDWAKVPAHLKTKTGLRDAGLRLAPGQQPVALKTHWDDKIPTYKLYNMHEAVPRKPATPAQLAAIEKAKAASLKARTCTRCGFVEELSRHYRGKVYVRAGLCSACQEDDWHKANQQEAIDWARALVQRADAAQMIILDTETVDLFAEVIELAIIDAAGNALYQSRFRNTEKIDTEAQRVHGIRDEDLLTCPAFADEYPRIKTIIEGAPLLIIYNAGFDVACLNHTCALYGLEPLAFPQTEDLFGWNNVYQNEWSRYWQDYRWQPLGGDHTALGDCRAALALLHEMAEAFTEEIGTE